MQKLQKLLKNLNAKLSNNALELWTAIVLFVGLPTVAWLYFDYRAALLVFVVLNTVVGITALRVR